MHARHPIAAIVKIAWQTASERSCRSSRLWKSPVAAVHQGLQRRVENWQHRRRMSRVRALLSSEETSLPDVPMFVVGSRALHTVQALSMFHALAPDILIVSHAPLLKPPLFQLPRIAALNIHWGIAPQYRGEHTLFWPLYFGDYVRVGVTIHRIDAGIDTGPILAQGFPSLGADDDEVRVLARCARVAADLMGDVLDAAAQGDPLVGCRSAVMGRQFRGRDRTFLHDVGYWARRRLLGQRPPEIAARRALFLQDVARPGLQNSSLLCDVSA
jgi:methionyl-tRNA formyltransferase